MGLHPFFHRYANVKTSRRDVSTINVPLGIINDNNNGWSPTHTTGIIKTITVFLSLILFFSCALVEETEPIFDNPLDPEDPGFIPPETFLVQAPQEGAVLDTHAVTITWTGNDGVVEYSYNLNNGAGSDWSPWTIDTTVTFTYLDEGLYTFEVKGRYHEEAEDDTPDVRSFEINDIHGPALMFGPRKVMATDGKSFTIDLVAEDVTDLMAVYAEIEYDTLSLKLEQVQVRDESGDFLVANNGSVVDIIEEDPATAVLKVNLGVATGDPPGVSGTWALIRLTFLPLQTGTSQILFDNGCVLFDSDLNEVLFDELVDGLVEVVQ